MKNYSTRFVQSQNDFPCRVTVGGARPSWELERWGDRRHKNKLLAPEARLRFAPDGEDDFCVRGCSNSILYKGKNISHRWTLLGGNDFEYDVILKKPPLSNVISLSLDGGEQFDFYRQPVSRKNPLLSGSYAVYLKRVLTGQGTGKLCHIYRPRIVDASGASVWGELSVSGGKLFIAIPENWLARAVYPVLVDPVVGCSAVGSQREWDPWDEGESRAFFLEQVFPVNNCLLTQDLSGAFTCYFYCAGDASENTNTGIPALYSDLGGVPYQRLTKNESNINFHTSSDKWVSGTIATKSAVSAGNTVWFGAYLLPSWLPVFDYGGKLFIEELYKQNYLPETYPHYTYLNKDEAYNIRLSMYFQYGAMSENYSRVITAGVCLSDSVSKGTGFRRVIASGVAAFQNSVKGSLFFLRRIADNASALFNFTCPVSSKRFISDNAAALSALSRSVSVKRFISDTARSLSNSARGSLGFIRGIIETAAARCSLSRRLAVAVKIVTLGFVRDYIVRRFLLAGARLVIKSKITREIVIESKIK
jgi:hypothetical protein